MKQRSVIILIVIAMVFGGVFFQPMQHAMAVIGCDQVITHRYENGESFPQPPHGYLQPLVKGCNNIDMIYSREGFFIRWIEYFHNFNFNWEDFYINWKGYREHEQDTGDTFTTVEFEVQYKDTTCHVFITTDQSGKVFDSGAFCE